MALSVKALTPSKVSISPWYGQLAPTDHIAGQTEHPYGVCSASHTWSVPIPYLSFEVILTESRVAPEESVVVLSTCARAAEAGLAWGGSGGKAKAGGSHLDDGVAGAVDGGEGAG